MKFRILKHKRVLYYLLLIFNLQLNAEAAKIVSGPILGYSTLKEVLVWIQTDQASKVALEYSEIGNPRNRYISETIQTDYKTGFIAKLIANRVEPGKSYNYNLLVDGKRIKGEHPQTFQAQSFLPMRPIKTHLHSRSRLEVALMSMKVNLMSLENLMAVNTLSLTLSFPKNRILCSGSETTSI